MSFVRICSLLSRLGLPVCDDILLKNMKPGVSTGAEVRALLGEPGMIWQDGGDKGDGGEVWEYSRQPEGTVCQMLTFGKDGVLSGIEHCQVKDRVDRVRPGMSKDQVRRLLGRPRSRQTFLLQAEEVWDWKLPREISCEVYFNVHFDAGGRVSRTSLSQNTLG